jgi:hypothetical protein
VVVDIECQHVKGGIVSKPVRIKVEDKPQPDLRKLARALLLLVEEQSSKPATKGKRKAS